MNIEPVTEPQARALSELLATVRTQWAPSASANAIYEVRDRGILAVTQAAVRAALDPDIRTPAGIAWIDRPHWQAIKPSDATPQVPSFRERWRNEKPTTPADPEFVQACRQRLRGHTESEQA